MLEPRWACPVTEKCRPLVRRGDPIVAASATLIRQGGIGAWLDAMGETIENAQNVSTRTLKEKAIEQNGS